MNVNRVAAQAGPVPVEPADLADAMGQPDAMGEPDPVAAMAPVTGGAAGLVTSLADVPGENERRISS